MHLISFFDNFLNQLHWLYYSIPSAFIVLLFREWFRNLCLSKLLITKPTKVNHSSLVMIDPFACICMSFGYFSWGGSLQRNRDENFQTIVSSQVALVILFFILKIYYIIKQPTQGSYIFYFCQIMSMQIGLTFFINFIPLPPFDFSTLYIKNNFRKKRILTSLKETSNKKSLFKKFNSNGYDIIFLSKSLLLFLSLFNPFKLIIKQYIPYFLYLQ